MIDLKASPSAFVLPSQKSKLKKDYPRGGDFPNALYINDYKEIRKLTFKAIENILTTIIEGTQVE